MHGVRVCVCAYVCVVCVCASARAHAHTHAVLSSCNAYAIIEIAYRPDKVIDHIHAMS